MFSVFKTRKQHLAIGAVALLAIALATWMDAPGAQAASSASNVTVNVDVDGAITSPGNNTGTLVPDITVSFLAGDILNLEPVTLTLSNSFFQFDSTSLGTTTDAVDFEGFDAAPGVVSTTVSTNDTVKFTPLYNNVTQAQTAVISGVKIRALAGTGAGGGAITNQTVGTVNKSQGVADHLAFTTQPANSTADDNLLPVVTIQDQFNNTVTGAPRNITLTIDSSNFGSTSLDGTAVLTTVSGVAQWQPVQVLKIAKATDSYVLRATASGPALPGSQFVLSTAFTITHGAATSLVTNVQPSASTVAGVAFATQPEVRIFDAKSNLVTTGAGSTLVVTAALTTGAGTLSGTLTEAAVGGIADFAGNGLSIDLIGADKVLTFTASGVASANTSAFAITHAPEAVLAVTTQPSATTVAGVAFATQPVVEIRDAFGNLVSTGAGSSLAVIATLTTGTGTLTDVGAGNQKLANAGVADYLIQGLEIDLVGTDKVLTFSATGVADAVSSAFTITHAAASELAVTTQPSPSTVAGVAFATQPVVEIRDAFGNLVSTGAGSTLTLTAALSTGAGALSGTATDAAVAGVANFAGNGLSIDIIGADKVLTFTATGVAAANTSAFAITHAGVAALAITTAPWASTVAGVGFAIQPVVEIRDAFGNVVSTGAGSTLTVTAANTAGTGTLSGTLTRVASFGVASFGSNGLSIDLIGDDKVLTFSATGATDAVSSAFAITHAPAAALAVTTQPSASSRSWRYRTHSATWCPPGPVAPLRWTLR